MQFLCSSTRQQVQIRDSKTSLQASNTMAQLRPDDSSLKRAFAQQMQLPSEPKTQLQYFNQEERNT